MKKLILIFIILGAINSYGVTEVLECNTDSQDLVSEDGQYTCVCTGDECAWETQHTCLNQPSCDNCGGATCPTPPEVDGCTGDNPPASCEGVVPDCNPEIETCTVGLGNCGTPSNPILCPVVIVIVDPEGGIEITVDIKKPDGSDIMNEDVDGISYMSEIFGTEYEVSGNGNTYTLSGDEDFTLTLNDNNYTISDGTKTYTINLENNGYVVEDNLGNTHTLNCDTIGSCSINDNKIIPIIPKYWLTHETRSHQDVVFKIVPFLPTEEKLLVTLTVDDQVIDFDLYIIIRARTDILAVDDMSVVQTGSSITIDVTHNDNYIGFPLTLELVSQPSRGNTMVVNGNIFYTSTGSIEETDDFQYRITVNGLNNIGLSCLPFLQNCNSTANVSIDIRNQVTGIEIRDIEFEALTNGVIDSHNGNPNYTKGMESRFFADVYSNQLFTNVCNNTQCTVDFILGDQNSDMVWNGFLNRWEGVLDTKDLDGNSVHTLTVNANGFAFGTSISKSALIYVNNEKTFVIEPINALEALGTSNKKIFNVDFFDPESNGVEQNYRAEIIDSDLISETEKSHITWLTLVNIQNIGPGSDRLCASNQDSTCTNVDFDTERNRYRNHVLLSQASRAGEYDVDFRATYDTTYDKRATLSVFAEGLNEFQTIQLLFIIVFLFLIRKKLNK